MSPGNPHHVPYHPKWHRARLPIFWWLKKLAYSKFITRELTSLAVCYAGILLLVQVWVLSRGPAAHQRFTELLASPVMLVFHGLVLAALLFHSVTWFNLAPQALVVRVGRRRVPDAAVLAGHYAAWVAATLLVVWYLTA